MGIVSPHYDGSFGGIGFMELFPNQIAVEPDTAAEFTATHISGGNTTFIQTAGLIAQTLDLAIGADAAELSALRGKVLTHATLVYHAGSVSARLMRVKSVHYNNIPDAYDAVLELILG
jgi:hypothetical protein